MERVERNLKGLKVLDFTRVLVGPTLTQLLADNGAEVIKIEKPFYGADERHNAPIIKGKNGFQSGYYVMVNRGKKSIVLDMKDPECKEVIFGLIKWADVLCENFAPNVMEKLGFSYKAAKEINQSLIYCSMSVFGQEGPYAHLPGYDIIAQAMSGLLWLTGDQKGPPMKSGTGIGDVLTAGFAWGALGAALYYREKTGKGQHIDISMRDCLASVLETGVVRYTLSGGKDIPMRSGNHHATMTPYGVFNAGKDRYVVIVALNPNHWESLCQAMGKEEWGKQEKFKDNLQRGINQKEVNEVIEDWLKAFDDVTDAIKILQNAHVPASPVLTIPELCQDQQWLMRNNLVEVNDPVFGHMKVPASAMIFSETSVYNPVPAPMLGENTSEVLRDILHMSEEKIKRIIEKYDGK